MQATCGKLGDTKAIFLHFPILLKMGKKEKENLLQRADFTQMVG